MNPLPTPRLTAYPFVDATYEGMGAPSGRIPVSVPRTGAGNAAAKTPVPVVRERSAKTLNYGSPAQADTFEVPFVI